MPMPKKIRGKCLNCGGEPERPQCLICPNCDSLTETYAGLNRGNGRRNRVLSKRAKEGKLFLQNAGVTQG